MKVLTKIPTTEYPYLAVWVGKDQSLDPKLLHNIKLEDIVLISMVTVKENDEQCNKQPYVQYILGGKEAYTTKHEDEYCPLPAGYSLELCQ